MNDQDKRAVESLCLCGMDFESICRSFSNFPRDEMRIIYDDINSSRKEETVNDLSINCS